MHTVSEYMNLSGTPGGKLITESAVFVISGTVFMFSGILVPEFFRRRWAKKAKINNTGTMRVRPFE